MTQPVRIPVDVEREDTVVANLSARQVLLLAVSGLALYGLWGALRTLVPLPFFLLLALPLGGAGAALALGRREGTSLDRLALAAARHLLSSRVRLCAPEGLARPPLWLARRAQHTATARVTAVAAEEMTPVRQVSEAGLVDLGAEGLAVIAVCSSVNFALRSPAEQEALVGAFGRYLHSLTAPVQILVRAQRLDLHGELAELRERASALPNEALRSAAYEHAGHVEELGRGSDLLRRQVLLVWREVPPARTRPGRRGREWGRRRAQAAAPALSPVSLRAAEARLVRRMVEAQELLAPSGITVTPLGAAPAHTVLKAACRPDACLPPSPALAAPEEVVTAGGGAPETLGPTSPSAALAFAPDALAVGSRHVEVGADHIAAFAVSGYPREVYPGWLQPLLTHPGRLDVALHIDPLDPVTAASRLKRQLARLESGRRYAQDRGQLQDPYAEAAAEDAYELSARVARGEGKLYRLGLYLAVHAGGREELGEETAALRSLAASLLLDAQPLSYRSLQGWTSCLPLGLDAVRLRRTFDTEALAAAFPFASPDLPPADPVSLAPGGGVLYGYNAGSQGLVHWDRFAQDNHNAVLLGRSGAGKSYLLKLELLRSLYRGVHAHIIDPEDEYVRLARAVGGTCIRLGAEGVRLNPLDLPVHTRPDGRRAAPKDALVQRSLFLHTLLAVLLEAPLEPAARAALDRAATAAYAQAGITCDPRSWRRPAPLLADVADALERGGGTAGAELGARLRPFTHGSFRGLFAGATTSLPEGHLVVFSLRALPAEVRSAGTLLALDAVWRQVSSPALRRPRLVAVDEGWLLMRQQAGADFLFRMAKAGRRHWAGLTVATQDTADLLGSQLGKAVVANAATQILLRQAPQAIDEVTRAFSLSQGERQFLLSAERGQGLLAAGQHRVAFTALASPSEHQLITTDPAELAGHAASRAPAQAQPAAPDGDFTSLSADAEGHFLLGPE
ncbi:PrgI family protein [Streptomyces sp. ODS28]|uniref:TraG/VirB4 family ATPase n=1 Tax=Streptomyces sp. ODS28 TaxID=3136688 RepID=UPI0031E65E47